MQKNTLEMRVGPWNMTAYPEYIRSVCLVKLAALKAAEKHGKIEKHIANTWLKGYQAILDNLKNCADLEKIDTYLGFGSRLFKAIDALAAKFGGAEDQENPIKLSDYALSSTTLHVVVCETLPALIDEVKRFHKELSKKAVQFAAVKKMGRKHLRDAADTTLGSEFSVLAEGFATEVTRLEEASKKWGVSWIGSSLSGIDTFASADDETKKEVCLTLSNMTKKEFSVATTAPDSLNVLTNLLALHSNLQEISIQLWRVAHDIRILCSGPRTGIAEITVPAVAPGSSIMPGKLNPVMAEMIYTSADQIDANHAGIAVALKCGWLESTANSSIPVRNYLDSWLILKNSLKLFNDKCIVGIEPNSDKHSLQRVMGRS